MKSKTKISKQILRKTNTDLFKLIIQLKKNNSWIEVASILSSSSRKRPVVNLDKINNFAKVSEKILVPGKVLSMGEINKKIKIIALSASEEAQEKIKNAGSEFYSIEEELNQNPDAKGIKILK
jgi:large subunit ribosomal protein L18e